MDISYFFKKCSVKINTPLNQISLSKFSNDTLRLIENSCLKVVIARMNAMFFYKGNIQKIKLESQRNANGMMLILCMGFIAQK